MDLRLSAYLAAMLALAVLPGAARGQGGAECAVVDCARAAAEQSPASRRLWEQAAGVRGLELAFAEAVRTLAIAQAGALGSDLPEAERAVARDALARWDAAIRQLESAAASQLRAAETHLVLGRIYLDRRRTADAVRALAEAARIEPERSEVHAWLALAHAVAGEPGQEMAALRKAVALDPSNAAVIYRYAQVLRDAGRLDEWRQALQRFVRLRSAVPVPAPGARPPLQSVFDPPGLLRQAAGVAPVFPSAAHAEAFARLESGAYESAVAGPARAGEAASAVVRRALDSWVAGDHNGAVRELRTAIEQRPGDERARLALAFVLREANRPSEAERELRDATVAFPRAGLPWYRLGQLLESQARLPEAVQALQESLTRAPILGLDALYQRLARIHVNQADFDAAIRAYAARVSINPNSGEAHRSLGEIYYLQGRDDEALAEFLVAVWLDPNDARALAALGKVHVRGERYAEAAPVLRRAIALEPSRADAHYALGQALVRLGRGDEARRQTTEFQRLDAEERARGQRDFRIELERVEAARLVAGGDVTAALDVLRRLAEEDPQNPRWPREQGAALLRARRFADAAAVLEAVQARHPTVEAARLLADALAAAGRADEARQQQTRYEQAARESRLAQVLNLENGP